MGRRGQGKGHRPAGRPYRRDRPLPGRQQRRPHDRPRRGEVQVPPDPVRHPALRQGLRDRQRRRARPEDPARGDRRPAPARRRRRQPEDLRQRPPDHALPRAARYGGRAEAGQALAGDDPARHRPLLRRQGAEARHPRPGPARREDPAHQDPHGAGAQAAGAARTLGAAAQAAQGGRRGGRPGGRAGCRGGRRPAPRPARDDRGTRQLRPPPRAPHRRHGAALLGHAGLGSGPSSSRGPRQPCSTSTTAPIPSSPPPTRSPVRQRSVPASARPTSTRSGASPRPTRRGSAPARSRPSSTTRSGAGWSSAARSSGRPRGANGAAAGSTWSPSATPSGSTG